MDFEYCKNTFLNKSSLKNHQKNAKYCLALQQVDDNVYLSCNNCNKNLLEMLNLIDIYKYASRNHLLYKMS